MSIYVLGFLIGVVTGLRTFMGITAVSWAARLHAIELGDTKLAFLGYAATPYILSALALGELVTDQLPKTPSRLVPPQFGARVVMGALAGAALGAANHAIVAGLITGVLGAVVGTVGGAKLRGALAKAFGRDMPAALLEDLVAIGLAIFVVTRGAL
ncbi:MAG: DUF4126 domain-containing protein [Acidobacteriota bacterium]|nr:DUF4126 domain-containing protein [Acidobacteriota bacterium]